MISVQTEIEKKKKNQKCELVAEKIDKSKQISDGFLEIFNRFHP